MSEEKSYKQKFTEEFKDEWNKKHSINNDEPGRDSPYYSIYYNKKCKVIVVVEKLFEGYYHDGMVDILVGMYPSETGSFEDVLNNNLEGFFDE